MVYNCHKCHKKVRHRRQTALQRGQTLAKIGLYAKVRCEKRTSNIAVRCKRHLEMLKSLGVCINCRQYSNSIKCI